MTKPKDEMTRDEYDVWFDALSKSEQLAEMREFRSRISSIPAPDGATEEELADLDMTITFLEVATAFEAATRVEDVKALPEVDALSMMWEFIGDLASDPVRRAELDLDVDKLRRWSKTIGTMHNDARRRRKELRAKGIAVPRLWRVERISEPEADGNLVAERPLRSIVDMPSLLPITDGHDKN